MRSRQSAQQNKFISTKTSTRNEQRTWEHGTIFEQSSVNLCPSQLGKSYPKTIKGYKFFSVAVSLFQDLTDSISTSVWLAVGIDQVMLLLLHLKNVCLVSNNVLYLLSLAIIQHRMLGTKHGNLFKLNPNRNVNKLVRHWLCLDHTSGLHETLASGHLTEQSCKLFDNFWSQNETRELVARVRMPNPLTNVANGHSCVPTSSNRNSLERQAFLSLAVPAGLSEAHRRHRCICSKCEVSSVRSHQTVSVLTTQTGLNSPAIAWIPRAVWRAPAF